MGRGSIRKALIPEEKVTIKSNPLQALLQPIQAILIGFFANTQTDNATVSTGASSCTDGDDVHGSANPFHVSLCSIYPLTQQLCLVKAVDNQVRSYRLPPNRQQRRDRQVNPIVAPEGLRPLDNRSLDTLPARLALLCQQQGDPG